MHFESPAVHTLRQQLCTAGDSECILVELQSQLYCHCKVADDMVVLGVISDNDELVYMEEVVHLTKQCQFNNLQLNVSKNERAGSGLQQEM